MGPNTRARPPLFVRYLIPSAAYAAAGLLQRKGWAGVSSWVRARDACSSDFHLVGIQAYLLSREGATRVLDRFWPRAAGAAAMSSPSDLAQVSANGDYCFRRPSSPWVISTCGGARKYLVVPRER